MVFLENLPSDHLWKASLKQALRFENRRMYDAKTVFRKLYILEWKWDLCLDRAYPQNN